MLKRGSEIFPNLQGVPASVNLLGASLSTRAPVTVVLAFMRTLLLLLVIKGNASNLQYNLLGSLYSLMGGNRVVEWIGQDLVAI